MNKRNWPILIGVGAIVIAIAAVYLLSRRDTRSSAAAGPTELPAEAPVAAPLSDNRPPAAVALRHLPLDSFKVPELVRFAFAAYRCDVPQPYAATMPTNVISGNFAAPDQTDWAALCTHGDSSYIMIVWGGRANCPTPTAAAANADFLQTVGNGQIGYSRGIGEAGAEYIRERAREHGGPRPPATNHAGIEDAFLGKASIIHYCYAGQWLALQGAD